MKSWYILLAAVLAAILPACALAQLKQKEHKLSAVYPAETGKLVIENRYGRLAISTWDRDEVSIAITMTARAQTERAAEELLGQVEVNRTAAKPGGIRYRTLLAGTQTTQGLSELRVDYVVRMPRRHPAAFSNKYGDIEIADADGNLEVELEYGRLSTGALRGPGKVIKVSFGSAAIPSIESGTITASYSRVDIRQAGSLQISNQYENTNVGTARELNIYQKYGDLRIGTVSQLRVNVQFASMVVDKLLKRVDMTLKYCPGVKFGHIAPEVDGITGSSSFSNLSVHLDEAVSLTADLNVSFGKVSNKLASFPLSRSSGDVPGQSASYAGKVGRGAGTMNLSLSYGNLVID